MAELDDCGRCGVIFARIKPVPGPLDEVQKSGPSADGFEGDRHQRCQSQTWGRVLILLGMLIWSGQLIFSSIASNAAGESLLHLVNLPFHEAGHVFFRPFGQFMMSLGGSLGQLLVPLICGGTLLLKTHDPFGGAVCGWWLGENLLDLAPYIGDARAGQLPLVGGNFGHSSPYGFHDWEYLLTETGLLRYDTTLAKLTHVSGSLVMIAAMVWAGCLVWRQLKGTGSEGACPRV
ncbi:MAG: hypothetical protein L3J63_07190 [Geopsychrobacter sp.]|nr:hypothetical protein [Geopsychrobacter sp.]